MKDVLLIGGIAVGGYLLFKWYEDQQATLATATATATASNTVSQPTGYPQGWITSNIMNAMVNQASTNPTYSSAYLANHGSLVFPAWSQIYLLILGYYPPATAHDINTTGDANTYPLTISDFASEVNSQINPALNTATLSGIWGQKLNAGLGVLGINQPFSQAQIGYQNKKLAGGLEIFNALTGR